jgi:predicted RND superfamily exporter protein
MKQKILDFPIQHARLIFVGLAVLTIGLGSAIPSIQVDTDPENMLSEHDAARVFHNETKEEFALHDLIVVGVVNETEPEGAVSLRVTFLDPRPWTTSSRQGPEPFASSG